MAPQGSLSKALTRKLTVHPDLHICQSRMSKNLNPVSPEPRNVRPRCHPGIRYLGVSALLRSAAKLEKGKANPNGVKYRRPSMLAAGRESDLLSYQISSGVTP